MPRAKIKPCPGCGRVPTLGHISNGKYYYSCGYSDCTLNPVTPACEKFKPIAKLTEKEFYEKYCQTCGSQRCEGVGTDWFDGCRHRYELEGYVDNE